MITLTTDSPLQRAIDAMDRRTPVGSAMTSREWLAAPAEVRDRSFWISRMEIERVLVEARRRLQQVIAQQRDAVEAGGRVMSRGRFVSEMKEVLRQVGYTPDPEDRGTLRDVSSTRRLNLIWQMNLDMAAGYSGWKAKQNEVSLRRAPARELVRVAGRKEVRDWPRIWAAAGGEFFGEPGPDYPKARGRMMAMVNDPIWTEISRFGVPWPPFDWGSGMGLRTIRRREALELGVIEKDTRQPPSSTPFNANLSQSIKGFPDESRERLRSELGDAVRFDGDRISYERNLSESNEHRSKTIPEELRDRARQIAERGRDQILRLGPEDDASYRPPGFDYREPPEELLASTSAVAVGRKQLYHEEWDGASAEFYARLIRGWLPDEVAVAVRDNHIHAWRPDLLTLTLDEIHEAAVTHTNGRLLGYGINLFETPTVSVSIKDQAGRLIGGFFAPEKTAMVYAKARARDFSDSMAAAVRIFINGEEVKP